MNSPTASVDPTLDPARPGLPTRGGSLAKRLSPEPLGSDLRPQSGARPSPPAGRTVAASQRREAPGNKAQGCGNDAARVKFAETSLQRSLQGLSTPNLGQNSLS